MGKNLYDTLSEGFAKTLQKLKGHDRISEINVAETLKEVRQVLTKADVNYKIAKTFIDNVKEKAIGQGVLTSLKPKDLMIKIIHDELTELMGGQNEPINLNGKPSIILMSGLQGSGKTTFSGKLAKMFNTQNNMRPLLVACDVYRPAAIEQIKVLGESIDVPVYTIDGSKEPVDIARKAVSYAKENKLDPVIIDTAGRLAIDEKMMEEIGSIKAAVNPTEILFVVDAMTGNDAVNTAKAFNDVLDFNGVILTKLDGDTKGGAAMSIRSVVNKPIKFIGTGETLDGIEPFHPERMAGRILGMGDIVTLVEKAQQQFDEEQARKIEEKLRKNRFTYTDFLQQIEQIQKMGNIKDLASMIPGVGKQIKDIDIDNDAFKSIVAIINSMTPYERENPDVIVGSRRQRIAKGSGTSLQEVNRLTKQFDQMRKMMRMATSMKNPMKMMKAMKNARR